MTGNFKRVFGDKKPVIAMVHLGALPGSPSTMPKRALRASSKVRARIFWRCRPRGSTP